MSYVCFQRVYNISHDPNIRKSKSKFHWSHDQSLGNYQADIKISQTVFYQSKFLKYFQK